MEALLDTLVERITTVCLQLSKFRISIDASRNKEWVEEQEELDLPTTDVQWRVIEQIRGLVVRVVQSSESLSTLDITINLKDSQEFLPYVIRSPYTSGSSDLIVDSNMLTCVNGRQVFDHYKELFGVILRKESIRSLTIRMLGLLPMLVGALGAIAGEATTRPYDTQDSKLAEAYREVFFLAGPLMDTLST